MKERPILFSAPMVRAVLDDSKTQTRRVVKLPKYCEWGRDYDGQILEGDNDYPVDELRCPYGQPGDRLWVREAWTTHAFLDKVPPRDLTTRSIHYVADGEIKTGKYRPPMFMPRWASRITLEIVSVRVERLQDISEADALAEGITSVVFRPDTGWPLCDGYMVGPDDGKMALETSAMKAYRNLWEQINGPGSWDLNPWVWVIEFKRVMP